MRSLTMETIVFRSKVDSWLRIVIIASALMSVGASIVAGFESWVVAVTLSPVLLLSAIIPVWFLRSTYYVLDDATLHVKSGPLSWTIPLSEIRSLKETRDPISSPALSFDRIRISYGRRKYILISPDDKAAFLAELEARRTGR